MRPLPPEFPMTSEETPLPAAEGPTPEQARAFAKDVAREASLLYVAALILVFVAALGSLAVGLIAQNLYAIVAAIFILLPYTLLTRRGMSFERYGLTTLGWPRGLLWGVGATLITVPLFFVGFYAWETQVVERDFVFDMDHYRQWPVELEGKPQTWGAEPGIWIWTTRGDLRIGLSGHRAPFHDIEVTGDQAFFWHTIGSARALPGAYYNADGGHASSTRARVGPADVWHLGPGPQGTAAEVVLSPRSFRETEEQLPGSLRIRAYATGGGAESQAGWPIYTGPSASPQGTEIEIERSMAWIWLWAMTHLFFVSLPEEFFYRGYLQTRIGQYFAARRLARGESEARRRWLGISPANLVTSALFALGHVLIPVGGALLISRAAVFFPSLAFGWLRERTDSIVAPVIYHGACNMMVVLAAVHFY